MKLFFALVLAGFFSKTWGQKVLQHIQFTQKVAGIAVNPQTNRVYVVVPSFGKSEDMLAVIDGNSDKRVADIQVPTGAYLPAVNVLTDKVYIGSCNNFRNPSRCFVTVIDGALNKVIATIPVNTSPGNGIQGIAVDSTNDRVFIANASDNVIEIIDGRTDKLIDRVGVSSGSPFSIAFNPFNGWIYVPLGNSRLDVIATRPKKLIATADTGKANTYAAVNWNTGQVFVADIAHGVEAVSEDEEEMGSDDDGPSFIASILNLQGKLQAKIVLNDVPACIDVDSASNLVFVASDTSQTLTVIDGNTHAMTASLHGIRADFIATNMLTGKVYLSGEGGVTVVSEK